MNKHSFSDAVIFCLPIQWKIFSKLSFLKRFIEGMWLWSESKIQIANPITVWDHVERRIPCAFHFDPQGCRSNNFPEEFQFIPIKSAESVDFSGDKKYYTIGNYVVK